MSNLLGRLCKVILPHNKISLFFYRHRNLKAGILHSSPIKLDYSVTRSPFVNLHSGKMGCLKRQRIRGADCMRYEGGMKGNPSKTDEPWEWALLVIT